MSVPTFEHDEPHEFADRPDGTCTVTGWPCPACRHLHATVLHLEPPYGALVRCDAVAPDPDWGVPHRCDREFLIAF